MLAGVYEQVFSLCFVLFGFGRDDGGLVLICECPAFAREPDEGVEVQKNQAIGSARALRLK